MEIKKKIRIPPGDYDVRLKSLRIRYDGKAQLFYSIVGGEFDGVVMKTLLQRKPITSNKESQR